MSSDPIRAALAAQPSEEDLYDLAEVFNGDPVPAMRRALELWGRSAAPTPSLVELVNPQPGYQPGTGREDGAQLVEGEWWAPEFGCNSLDTALDAIAAHIAPYLREPVAGVDVPGPDGDYGGLVELCCAEGVDPQVGVPLLQRARKAWDVGTAPPTDGEDRSQLSDGYHTFAELYEHRYSLMLAFMASRPDLCWFSKRHADGQLPFGSGDWFIVGANLPNGSITYHLPIELFSVARRTGSNELPIGMEWDGHTAGDVVKRLRTWAEQGTGATPTPPADGEAIGPEWRPCVKLPITVHVREQRPGETHVSTREGITPVNADDLIMRGVQGEEYPIGRELFNRTYRLGPAPASAENTTPTADGEVEELIWRLGWIGAQLSDIGWEDDSASVDRAAALLRQLPPEGLEAEMYLHPASGAHIVRDLALASGEPGWCWGWTVRDSRHVNPCTKFPTLAAAWEALQQARREETTND